MSSKRGPSRAVVVLNEARQRLERAKTNVAEQDRLLLAAKLVLAAHQESYDALEKGLARRTNGSKSSSTAPPVRRRSSQKLLADNSAASSGIGVETVGDVGVTESE